MPRSSISVDQNEPQRDPHGWWGRYGRVFIGTNTDGSRARAWSPLSRTFPSTSLMIRDVTDHAPGDINEELMILARLASG